MTQVAPKPTVRATVQGVPGSVSVQLSCHLGGEHATFELADELAEYLRLEVAQAAATFLRKESR